MTSPTPFECVASLLFGLALIHCFSVGAFQRWALRFPNGSIGENFFHLMGEVEIVFGLWAGLLILFLTFREGGAEAIHYIDSLNFTEPLFVFVIMVMASTRPILTMARLGIESLAKVLPLPWALRFYVAALVLGPLAGSLITEPAAMTVTALVLKEQFFERGLSKKFLYATLAVLFVNVSIGGTLTAYAAPPVLMVAGKWGWGSRFLFEHFGWKAILAVIANAGGAAFYFRKQLAPLPESGKKREQKQAVPAWLMFAHVVFLAGVVVNSHHERFFAGIFLFFLGFVTVTEEYQYELRLRDSLLVGFFLGGLVVLGGPQKWWLAALLPKFGELGLFLSSTVLTGFVDNAALTYLGSQVPSLTDGLKYALLAGSVTGGGLTVIANAPNPAGYTILKSSFGEQGVSPVSLFLYALIPTLVAAAAFWLLP